MIGLLLILAATISLVVGFVAVATDPEHVAIFCSGVANGVGLGLALAVALEFGVVRPVVALKRAVLRRRHGR